MIGRGLGFRHIRPASGHREGSLTQLLQDKELPVEVASVMSQADPRDLLLPPMLPPSRMEANPPK